MFNSASLAAKFLPVGGAALAIATVQIVPVFSAPAWAQSGSTTGLPNPICMIRTGNADTGAVIVVTPDDVPGMHTKGFQTIGCAVAFESHADLISFRDSICVIASIPDKPTQDSYEAQFGERPAVLCGMAEQALGQWKRRGEN